MQDSEFRMQNDKNEFGVNGYKSPRLEFIELNAKDVITTSIGTETTPKEDNDGIWDFDLG